MNSRRKTLGVYGMLFWTILTLLTSGCGKNISTEIIKAEGYFEENRSTFLELSKILEDWHNQNPNIIEWGINELVVYDRDFKIFVGENREQIVDQSTLLKIDQLIDVLELEGNIGVNRLTGDQRYFLRQYGLPSGGFSIGVRYGRNATDAQNLSVKELGDIRTLGEHEAFIETNWYLFSRIDG